MKKSKVLLIGAAAVCMGLFVRKMMKNSAYDAEDPKGNATAPVNQAEKPKSNEKAPVAKAEEPKGNPAVPVTKAEELKGNAAAPVNKEGELVGRVVEQKKPEEKPASAAESPATTPCEKELAIVPQNATPTKEYIERRKKQIIEKKSSGEEMVTNAGGAKADPPASTEKMN